MHVLPEHKLQLRLSANQSSVGLCVAINRNGNRESFLVGGRIRLDRWWVREGMLVRCSVLKL